MDTPPEAHGTSSSDDREDTKGTAEATGEWPDPAPSLDPAKAAEQLYGAQLEIEKGRASQALDKGLASYQSELQGIQKFGDSIIGVAAGSIERSRAGADAVQKAAASIATIYTGVLGVSFSVAQKALPLRGILAPIFLGISLVLATAYRAKISKADSGVDWPAPSIVFRDATGNRVDKFIAWSNSLVSRGAFLLRSSVVALGVGVILLPAAFIHLPGTSPRAAPSAPAWPAPPSAKVDEDYGRILYKAKIDEVARLRSIPVAASDDTLFVVIAGGVGCLLVVCLSLRRRG